jgi:hypothetical protein
LYPDDTMRVKASVMEAGHWSMCDLRLLRSGVTSEGYRKCTKDLMTQTLVILKLFSLEMRSARPVMTVAVNACADAYDENA